MRSPAPPRAASLNAARSLRSAPPSEPSRPRNCSRACAAWRSVRPYFSRAAESRYGTAPRWFDVVRPVAVADVGAVEIVVPVDVDVHVVVVPVPAAPQRGARDDAGAPEESVDERRVRHRPVRRVVRRVRGPPPTAVHDRRLVGRHVDDLRIRRLDHDVGLRPFLLHLDLLLLVALQISGGLGLPAQVLHGVHHLRLLREERVAQLLRPGEVLVHPVQHLGEGGQRFDALVPWLVLQRILQRRALQSGILLAPACGLDDLERIRRRHQHLRQQRIRVERDRGQHRVEFLLLEGRTGRGGLRARRRGGSRRRHVLRRGCGRNAERHGDSEQGERAVSHRDSPDRDLIRMRCSDEDAMVPSRRQLALAATAIGPGRGIDAAAAPVSQTELSRG